MWGARDVAGNGIGDSGGAKVAEALTMNTTLTHLYLYGEDGCGDAFFVGVGMRVCAGDFGEDGCRDACVWVWGCGCVRGRI